MKRYSILVRETGSDIEVELFRVDNNPKAIAAALNNKRLRSGKHRWKKYDWIRIVDNDDASSVPHLSAE